MMRQLGVQVCFDGKRLILRNVAFFCFSLGMPAGFYLLFTRMMVAGSDSGAARYQASYMCSMIVYSCLIGAVFSMGNLLNRDRQTGFVATLKLTPGGTRTYYVSMLFWGLMMNLLALLIMGCLAVLVNHVTLTVPQWLALAGTVFISQLPLLVVALWLARISRGEILALVSNLVTFPVAILSGLWWPISMMPDWVQSLGKMLPTYQAVTIMSKVVNGGKINLSLWLGLILWFAGLLIAVRLTAYLSQKKRGTQLVKV